MTSVAQVCDDVLEELRVEYAWVLEQLHLQKATLKNLQERRKKIEHAAYALEVVSQAEKGDSHA